jgi:hypothetical protein
LVNTSLLNINSRHLQVLQVRVQGKCDKLETACREEENKHWQKMAKLEEKNKVKLNLLVVKCVF